MPLFLSDPVAWVIQLWRQRVAASQVKKAASAKREAVRSKGTGRRHSKTAARADAARMLAALRTVLDRHETSRSVLAHLSVVEQALEHRGVQALDDVPADVLRRALTQLESLVADWSETGIAALRAQLKTAMAKPGRLDVSRPAEAPKASTEFDNSRLMVNEASVSIFMEAHARWEGSLTGGR